MSRLLEYECNICSAATPGYSGPMYGIAFSPIKLTKVRYKADVHICADCLLYLVDNHGEVMLREGQTLKETE